jgi:hypothetical protein
VGEHHGLDPVAKCELGQDVAHVALDRRERDDQLVGDLGALAMGLGMVAVAVRLGAPGTMRIAVGLVLAHVAFGVVKLVGYGETEAVGFFAVDLLILAVVTAANRSRR